MTRRYLVNPGVGRRVVFHGTFKSKADAARKERAVGGFVRKRKVGRAIYWMVLSRKDTPTRRRGKGARNTSSEARTMARRRRSSRRRKSSARRSRRRAVARVQHSNPRHRRRSSARHTARRAGRRHFRRHPPRGGFFGRILGAFTDGLS